MPEILHAGHSVPYSRHSKTSGNGSVYWDEGEGHPKCEDIGPRGIGLCGFQRGEAGYRYGRISILWKRCV